MSTAPFKPHVVDIGISEQAFMIAPWIFSPLAILTMAARTFIRIRAHGMLQVDDYILIFASVVLLAATVVTHTERYYIFEASRLDLMGQLPNSLDELKAVIYHEITFIFVYDTLIWTTIYSAKFAYLWFFRNLVLRIKPLLRAWWAVCIITLCSYVVSIVHAFTVCPWQDLRAVQCTSPYRVKMTIGFSIAIMVLDVLSDIMIVLIPVLVLFKVKIRTSQKLGLAMFLCLSVILAALTVVRISRLRTISYYGTPSMNEVWSFFWLHIEASMAICLVSLTAFRSFFVVQERKRQEKAMKKNWAISTLQRLGYKRGKVAKTEKGLPDIPHATMTGLRSFFGMKNDYDTQGKTFDSTTSSDDSGEIAVGQISIIRKPSQILVTKTFGTDVQEVQPDELRYQPPSVFASTLQSATTAVPTQHSPSTQNSHSFDGSQNRTMV